MPLPKTKDVGKIMDKLKSEGGRPRKQMIAIALAQARKSGADIPEKKNTKDKINGIDKKVLAMKRRADKNKK